jgi:hypothetical protein
MNFLLGIIGLFYIGLISLSFILNIEISLDYKINFLLFGVSIIIGIILEYIKNIFLKKQSVTELKYLFLIGIILITIPSISSIDMFSAEKKYHSLKVFDGNISSVNNIAFLSIDKNLALSIGTKKLKYESLDDFVINKSLITLQNINGELTWVLPIDYKSFSTWIKHDFIPGYILISASDVNKKPLFEYKKIKYSKNSYFMESIDRFAYIRSGFKKCETHFEVDDEGNPYYVSLILEHRNGFIGYKVEKVLIINSITGINEILNIKDVIKNYPWIDILISEKNISHEIDWYGLYKLGFIEALLDRTHSSIKTGENLFFSIINGQTMFFSGMEPTQSEYRDLFKKLIVTNLSYGLFIDSKTGKTLKVDLHKNITQKMALTLLKKELNNNLLHTVLPQPLFLDNQFYWGFVIMKDNEFYKIALINGSNKEIFIGDSIKDVLLKINNQQIIVIDNNSNKNVVIDKELYEQLFTKIDEINKIRGEGKYNTEFTPLK